MSASHLARTVVNSLTRIRPIYGPAGEIQPRR